MFKKLFILSLIVEFFILGYGIDRATSCAYTAVRHFAKFDQ